MIGAIAVEHSEADFLLTSLLKFIYCPQVSLGWKLFKEMPFGKKVQLLIETISQLKPETPKGFLNPSEYEDALNLLSKLKQSSERRNDLMHGIVEVETDGDFAVLRSPKKKKSGVALDERTLKGILSELRTVTAQVVVQILDIAQDIEKRRKAEASQLKGSTIKIATKAVTGRIGNRTFRELRSTREIIPAKSER